MNRDKLVEYLDLAKEAAERQPEQYQIPAFKVILRHLLSETPMTAAQQHDTPRPASPTPIGASIAAGKQLNEFLAQLSPKSHPDRVCAISYFLFKEKGESTTVNDIVDAYSRARIRRPQNISDVLGSCVRKGRLVDTEKKDSSKAWVITNAGEAHVESLSD